MVSAIGLMGQNVESEINESTSRYDRSNAEYMLIEAQKFFLIEDYERALAFLDKSLEVDNKNDAAHFKKAEIYLIQNQLERGLESIKDAINLDSSNKYYYILGAELEKANKNLEGAREFYRLLAENTQDYKVYLVELANTYQGLGEGKEAIEIFEQFDNLSLDQNMKLVELYMQENQSKEAIQLMNELRRDYPTDNDLKYQYANLLNLAGQREDAIAYLESEPTKTAQMRLLLSELYGGEGSSNAQFQLLIESFHDPEANLTDKTLLLGQTLLETPPEQIPVKLIDSLQTNLEYQYADEVLAVENGAYVYSRLSEITEGNQSDLYNEKAINRYKKLKDLKPGDFKVWDKVLSYEYESGDWEALSADADEALSLYPNQAIFYIYLASAKINLQETEEAEDLLNQAARMTRSNELLTSQILGKRAEIALLQKDSTKAYQLFQEATSLGQIHPQTTKRYAAFIPAYSNTDNQNKETPRNKELKETYEQALSYFFQGDTNSALLAMIPKITFFEENKDGEALELYGDIYAELKLVDLALKYWKLAKAAGGASDKIDQKIANNQ